MSERMWHYLQANTPAGPVPESTLKQWLAAGQMPPDTFVWTDGMNEWAPASRVDALRPRAGTAPATGVTPSEVVLLCGEHFAQKENGLTGANIPLLTGEREVSAAGLGRALLTSALLVNERMGVLQLQVQQEVKKGLFGSKQIQKLMVYPGPGQYAWAPGTLEAGLQARAMQGPQEVSDLVYNFLGTDTASPWGTICSLVRGGLKERGLVTAHPYKQLGLFAAERYSAAPSAVAEATPQVPAVQGLLGSVQQRPDLSLLLVMRLDHAISRRTEAHNGDWDAPDFD